MATLYEQAGGMPAMTALAHAWHERVLVDPVVSHAFSHGFHPDHTNRLAAYFAEALGGPTTYSDSLMPQSDVVRMHSGNGEHDEMDQLALAAFVAAMEDSGLPDDPQLRQSLTDYFAWAIDDLNHRYRDVADVPDGLPLPHWPLDGSAE